MFAIILWAVIAAVTIFGTVFVLARFGAPWSWFTPIPDVIEQIATSIEEEPERWTIGSRYTDNGNLTRNDGVMVIVDTQYDGTTYVKVQIPNRGVVMGSTSLIRFRNRMLRAINAWKNRPLQPEVSK